MPRAGQKAVQRPKADAPAKVRARRDRIVNQAETCPTLSSLSCSDSDNATTSGNDTSTSGGRRCALNSGGCKFAGLSHARHACWSWDCCCKDCCTKTIQCNIYVRQNLCQRHPTPCVHVAGLVPQLVPLGVNATACLGDTWHKTENVWRT